MHRGPADIAPWSSSLLNILCGGQFIPIERGPNRARVCSHFRITVEHHPRGWAWRSIFEWDNFPSQLFRPLCVSRCRIAAPLWALMRLCCLLSRELVLSNGQRRRLQLGRFDWNGGYMNKWVMLSECAHTVGDRELRMLFNAHGIHLQAEDEAWFYESSNAVLFSSSLALGPFCSVLH